MVFECGDSPAFNLAMWDNIPTPGNSPSGPLADPAGSPAKPFLDLLHGQSQMDGGSAVHSPNNSYHGELQGVTPKGLEAQGVTPHEHGLEAQGVTQHGLETWIHENHLCHVMLEVLKKHACGSQSGFSQQVPPSHPVRENGPAAPYTMHYDSPSGGKPDYLSVCQAVWGLGGVRKTCLV